VISYIRHVHLTTLDPCQIKISNRQIQLSRVSTKKSNPFTLEKHRGLSGENCVRRVRTNFKKIWPDRRTQFPNRMEGRYSGFVLHESTLLLTLWITVLVVEFFGPQNTARHLPVP
jgi:hypothetical protein